MTEEIAVAYVEKLRKEVKKRYELLGKILKGKKEERKGGRPS